VDHLAVNDFFHFEKLKGWVSSSRSQVRREERTNIGLNVPVGSARGIVYDCGLEWNGGFKALLKVLLLAGLLKCDIAGL
jgi:hypothetical protein